MVPPRAPARSTRLRVRAKGVPGGPAVQQGVGGGGACSAAGGGGWPAVLMPRLLLAAGGPPAPSRGAPARLLSAGRGAGRAGLAQMPAGSGLCEGIACSLWTCLCGPWHSSLCFSLVVGVREREGGARCPSRYWWPRASRLSAPRQSVTRPLPLPAVAWLCERCLSRVAGGVSSLAGEWHRSVSLWPSGLGCPGWGEQQQTGDKCSEPGDRVPWTLQRLPQPRAPPACAQAQPSRPPSACLSVLRRSPAVQGEAHVVWGPSLDVDVDVALLVMGGTLSMWPQEIPASGWGCPWFF